MKSSKNIIRFITAVIVASLALNVYALDPMAKEETTPPAAEGALTAGQIPPVYSSDKNAAAPAGPATEPAQQSMPANNSITPPAEPTPPPAEPSVSAPGDTKQ